LTLAVGDVTIAVDKAIPCGLILNELITNVTDQRRRDAKREEPC
jgi:two-component sensor histidine kinase